MNQMIEKLAWNTFKNTGNINTFLELIEVENIQKKLKVNEYENIEDVCDNAARASKQFNECKNR